MRSSTGDHDGAIADYNSAIEIDPQLFRAYAGRGSARYDKGDLDGAIADCAKAIEINPQFAPPYVSRGVARLWQRKDAEAQKDFDAALKLDNSMKADLEQWINEIKRARKPKLFQIVSQVLKNSTRKKKQSGEA